MSDQIRLRRKDKKSLSYGQAKSLLNTQEWVQPEGTYEVVVFTDDAAAIRGRLSEIGLEEVTGKPEVPKKVPPPRKPVTGLRLAASPPPRQPIAASRQREPLLLKNRPYGFVRLPNSMRDAAPVWHDGSTPGLCGEVRLEITCLSPMLVGCERATAEEVSAIHPSFLREHFGQPPTLRKSLLAPLRAPWGERPVLIPADTLKGLLRHELGALLGAPMERVQERSYSYRPNAMFARFESNRLLGARIARVETNRRATTPGGHTVRVPVTLSVYRDLKYARSGEPGPDEYSFAGNGAPYRGGHGAGIRINAWRNCDPRNEVRLHDWLQAKAGSGSPPTTYAVPQPVIDDYLRTIDHLADGHDGHFAARHPDVAARNIRSDEAVRILLQGAETRAFTVGDLIWVEWDSEINAVTSFGWHYYYHWAYQDTVRKHDGKDRMYLAPTAGERTPDAATGAPSRLTAVRRLFGYSGDSEGSEGIGKDDHEQLMGRLAFNNAMEVIGTRTEQERFLAPTFLRELGMPRPSAVEHYLQQPANDDTRPKDLARLNTYGDLRGRDKPGELAGRKFYLHRDAAAGTWEDLSPENRTNERSTIVLEASTPDTRFRATLRFRDLEEAELVATLLALCPEQLKDPAGGRHPAGYASKIGYGRPLGWGTVRIEAKELLFLKDADDAPELVEHSVREWLDARCAKVTATLPALNEWMSVHRLRNPDAGPYPVDDERGTIPAYHSRLRQDHIRRRRYGRGAK